MTSMTYDDVIMTSRHLLNDDVVNGDVDQFDEEPDETHDGEPDGSCHGNLLEFLAVGFCASLHQTEGIFDELLGWFHGCCDLVHAVALLVETSFRLERFCL